MSMSRKHYIKFAEIIKEEKETSTKQILNTEQLKRIAKGMSGIFGADNPNFDSSTFMFACGFE